ncbi:MAG: DUF3520 domain-containing protein, partial [Phycisphaerales bacterium]|nr:DUF3520 domain-containing protein [Phycisphaerales bacterium]
RYKEPEGDQSKRLEFPVIDAGATWDKASPDLQFASAVASFGMILRNSPHKGTATLSSVLDLAEAGILPQNDKEGRRAEFRQLVEKARTLAGQ